jgi:predicted Zn-dependent protease
VATLQGNRTAAYEAARHFVTLAPNSLLHYEAALDALEIGRPHEAAEILTSIDPQRGMLRGWIFYWVVLTDAYHLAGEHKRELEAAGRARQLYPAEPGVVLLQIRALAAQGRIKDVQARLGEALTLSASSLAGLTPGDLLWESGRELRAHGHPEAAREVFARAVAWYRSRPAAEAATLQGRTGLANVTYAVEEWARAEELFAALAANDTSSVDYQGNLGALAARRGDRLGAERILRKLATIERPYLFGEPTYRRACIAALAGDRERAVSLLRDALAQGLSYGTRLHVDQDLEPLRDYPPFQELIRPKG